MRPGENEEVPRKSKNSNKFNPKSNNKSNNNNNKIIVNNEVVDGD